MTFECLALDVIELVVLCALWNGMLYGFLLVFELFIFMAWLALSWYVVNDGICAFESWHMCIS